MTARRSFLSQVTGAPLARPCDVPWNTMSGGEQVRRCDACDREVWNLSAMTAREAEIRLLNAAALPCINYRLDADGQLISRLAPRGLPARKLTLGAAAFVAGALLTPGHGTLTVGAIAAADDSKPPQCPPGGKHANPAPAPAAGGAAPTEPPPMGGAPPMAQNPPAGTVELKSAKPRDLVIDGVTFHAPGSIQLPPGKHQAEIQDGKKTIKRAFSVKLDAHFVLDLDR